MKKSNITLLKKFKPTIFFSFFFVLFLISILTTFGPQQVLADARDDARAAFSEGQTKEGDGDLAGACEAYRRAQSLIPHPTTEAAIARVCATTDGTPSTTTESATKTIPLQNPLGTTSVPVLIGNIIKTVLAIVGALALAMFIYGGFTWLTSGGSADKIKKGKDILIWAVIGLVVIFASYSLVDFLLTAFGVS